MFDTPPRQNLELKARCPDLASVRAVIQRLAISQNWVERQTDTYYRVPHGRLKLREINEQSAVLIWYDRLDRREVRTSSYYLVPVIDAARMHALLTAAFGVRVTVRKQRDIYLWHNVRIHLDDVAGLGSFIELEAVLSPDADEATSTGRLRQLIRDLAIQATDVLAPSYADLLMDSSAVFSNPSAL